MSQFIASEVQFPPGVYSYNYAVLSDYNASNDLTGIIHRGDLTSQAARAQKGTGWRNHARRILISDIYYCMVILDEPGSSLDSLRGSIHPKEKASTHMTSSIERGKYLVRCRSSKFKFVDWQFRSTRWIGNGEMRRYGLLAKMHIAAKDTEFFPASFSNMEWLEMKIM